MQDRMIGQTPIIARTNAPVQIPMYMPQGFGGNASIDQRTTDVLRGEINKSQNKLVDVESKLKERTEAQIQGSLDVSNTAKAKRHIKRKKEEDPDYQTLGEQRVNQGMQNVFRAWKGYKDEEKKNVPEFQKSQAIDQVAVPAPVPTTKKKKVVKRKNIKQKPATPATPETPETPEIPEIPEIPDQERV
jgi:hypothetical protein